VKRDCLNLLGRLSVYLKMSVVVVVRPGRTGIVYRPAVIRADIV
jgi:hypothetical protein